MRTWRTAALAAIPCTSLLLSTCVPPAAPASTPVPAAAPAASAAHAARLAAAGLGGLADADSLRAETVAPGVEHVFAWYEQGPWAIHVVAIDRAECVPVLEARKPAGSLAARATTSALATDALVTINADFFMLPGGTPVGAHVRAGVPFIGPTDRHIFGVTPEGRWVGGVARLDGRAVHRADTARLAQVNRPATPFSAYAGTRDGVTLFTARADSAPADSAARRLRLRIINGDERSGTAVVVAADSPASAAPVTAGSAVMLAHGDARPWATRRSPGDTIAWSARVVLPARGQRPAATVIEAVGGFPELLWNGQDVLGEQTVWPPFGEQRHPRTAVGWSQDGRRLFFVVVDGRRPPYSDGMSLPELTWLFRRLGAHDAVNLDGGGSTALVIGDRLMNRPTDAGGERTVGNALALAACAD